MNTQKNKLRFLIIGLVGVIVSISGYFIAREHIFSKKIDVEAQTVGTDWPQVQFDARHSGYVPQTVVPPYTLLWRRDRPFPISVRVQPIIASGFVFLPSNDGKLYALHKTTGQTAWTFTTENALVNSAAYDSGKVYVGSTDWYVYAVNATNGSLSWKYKTGGTVKTAPVISNGKVFIGSSDGYMYALDQNTGALSWRYNTGVPIYDTAAVDNGKVFFGGMNAKGYALTISDGSLLWTIQTKSQGFRDRWTVAGNGKVFFTPMIGIDWHTPLGNGTTMFYSNANPVIYNQPWATQKQQILDHLTSRPFEQPLYVVNQDTGVIPYTAPVLYITGGSQSPHSQVVLLPNGNANVMYRRSFGEAGNWGPTTNDVIYTGELNLSDGDIMPVETSSFRMNGPSDESIGLMRSGDVLYKDIARGTNGLDLKNTTKLQTVACYNTDGGGSCASAPLKFTDLQTNNGGWRLSYGNAYSELTSDGNDFKRPTAIADDTLYILHGNTIAAIKGIKR